MRIIRIATIALALGACAAPVNAAPILVDFEAQVDLEALTTQYSALGLVFAGATVLTAGADGGSLNDVDFPPYSGHNVAFDSSAGGIRVDFTTGATEVSGRFTYAEPVTMTAFAGANVLGSVTSQFSQNLAIGPNAANELLSLAFATPMTHVVLSASGVGASFTLDDFFVNTVDTQSVPEPATAALLLLGAVVTATRRLRAS